MRKMAPYRQNSVSEIDRLRIKELMRQYYRVWYAVYRPFILGPLVGLIAAPVVFGLLWLCVFQFEPSSSSVYFICVVISLELLCTPTALFMFGCHERISGECEIMREVLARPGYVALLPQMELIHPKAVKLIQRLLRSSHQYLPGKPVPS